MAGVAREGILFCLVGPTGCGKSSIGAVLLKQMQGTLTLSVSATSRQRRDNEREGEHYLFLSPAEFEKRIAAGEFFEYEKIHGNFYGTLRKTVEGAIASGIDLLLDIDIQGAETFFTSYPENTVIVFIVPPSPAEMESRIRARSAVSDEEIKRRFQTAESEYKNFFRLAANPDQMRPIQYFVINDTFEAACSDVAGILRAERCKINRMQKSDLHKVCSL